MSGDPEGGGPFDLKTLQKYLYAGGNPLNRIDPRGRAEVFAVDLENSVISFIDHGAAHLLEEGYDLVRTQAQVESYIESLVR